METKRAKLQQAVCPFSGEKLTDNMTVDEMAKSLRASCSLGFFFSIAYFNAYLMTGFQVKYSDLEFNYN